VSLWDAIATAALDLHPDRLELAARVAETRLPTAFAAWARGENVPSFVEVGLEWQEAQSLSGREVASALRAASRTAQVIRGQSRIDLVWSGPDTRIVPVRRTAQVMLEIIDSAEQTLFLVSFVAYNVEALLAALKKALARGVAVAFLLEDPEAGHITMDSPGLIAKALPGARIYQWNPTDQGSGGAGAVHAKCILADGKVAFITSANLTNAAMEKNMELGVRLVGGAIPEQLRAHFEALIATKVISLV